MPNLGPAELIIILAIALIVFGPKKLPDIGKGIGNALREFNKARNDFMDSLNSEAHRDEPYASPTASPSFSGEEAPSSVVAYDGERKVEFPEPLAEDDADALPYGSDFHAAGDSQPTFRTGEPEAPPVAVSAADPNEPETNRT